MADGTKIEWTDATWNPVTGCSVVSPGCTNCYAMKLAGTRLKHTPSRQGLTRDSKAGPVWTGEVRLNEQWLDQPLRWRRQRKIFVCAHGDLFAESVPDKWIDKVFAVMALAPQHTFQVLTKRAARMLEYVTARLTDNADDVRAMLTAFHAPHGKYCAEMAWPLPNVWLGVSAEDQARADERIPELLATPAAVRFVSAEPLLGPIQVAKWLQPGCPRCPPWETPCRIDCDHVTRINWIIAGGESGPAARPMHPAWARTIRDQCAAYRTPFFFKQWGEHLGGDGEDSGDGVWFESASVKTDSRWLREPDDFGWFAAAPEGPMHLRVGKRAAGRLLDGREHSAFPEARS